MMDFTLILWIFIIIDAFLFIFQLMTIFYSLFCLNQPIQEPVYEPLVSILKPLKFDVNLEIHVLKENLQSFFKLSYSNYEIFFCIKDIDDQILPICEELVKEFPNIKAKICIGGKDIGINPKINNIHQGYKKSAGEYIWICDANIRAHSESLKDLINHAQEDSVGLVHALPIKQIDNSSFASIVENIYFGGYHSRMYLMGDILSTGCVSGMSNLVSRKALEESCKGLNLLSDFIAEDYFMAKFIKNEGYKIKLSTLPALQNTSNSRILGHCRRLSRWTTLRFSMIPLTTFLEPLSFIGINGFLASVSINYFTGISLFILFSLHCVIWFLSDILLLQAIQNDGVFASWTDLFCGWVLMEMLYLPIFIRGICCRTLTWRNQSFRVKFGGRACKIFDEKTMNENILI